MKGARILFTILLAAIVMAQPVLACGLVHAESPQHDEAPEAPPCHGQAEANNGTPPESDTCSRLGDCALTSINHQNSELKTESGTTHPEGGGDFTVHQIFGSVLATCSAVVCIDRTGDEPFAHQTPISLKERLLI